ncbi:hypothetical protein F5B21DRAFT_503680 [Xylaria acuta]|nr:hypothetical protein F5B21DRAFT_503680 [Xylaria acuta]
MAPQISSPAQRKRDDFYIPPELVVMIFEKVNGPDWPEMWFSMRAVCRMWKVEIEKQFLKQHLQKLTLWAWPRSRGIFKYTIQEIPGERAIVELKPKLQFLKYDLLQNMEILQTGTVLRVSALELGIFQCTKLAELVDLQVDTKGERLSIQWLPMVTELFKRVCSQKAAHELM